MILNSTMNGTTTTENPLIVTETKKIGKTNKNTPEPPLNATALEPGLLSIEDPLLLSNDVGKGSYAAGNVRQAFEYAYRVIHRAIFQQPLNKNCRLEYYNRSTLSRIIRITDEIIRYRAWIKNHYGPQIKERYKTILSLKGSNENLPILNADNQQPANSQSQPVTTEPTENSETEITTTNENSTTSPINMLPAAANNQIRPDYYANLPNFKDIFSSLNMNGLNPAELEKMTRVIQAFMASGQMNANGPGLLGNSGVGALLGGLGFWLAGERNSEFSLRKAETKFQPYPSHQFTKASSTTKNSTTTTKIKLL